MGTFEKKGWFRIELPEGWEVREEAGGPTAFGRRGGAGALQVTAQASPRIRPGEPLPVDLLFEGYLRGIGVDPDPVRAERFRRGGAEWAAAEFVEEGAAGDRTFWRLWMALGPGVLLFVTYACPEPERERDREVVEGIVATLVLEGADG